MGDINKNQSKREINKAFEDSLAKLYENSDKSKLRYNPNDQRIFKKIFDPALPCMFMRNKDEHFDAVKEYVQVVNKNDVTNEEIQAAAKKYLLKADLKQAGLDAVTISAMGAGALTLIFVGLIIASLASPAAAAGTAAMLLKPAFVTSLKIACQHAASIMLSHHAAIPPGVAAGTVVAFLGKVATNPHTFLHHSRIKAFKPEKVKDEDDTSSLLVR